MNNSLLNGIKAMPLKDSTSDGTDNFALFRNEYMRSYPQSNMNDMANGKIVKKWYGINNRDSSSYTRELQTNEIGVGSLNAKNTPFSFTSSKEKNTVNDALRRVRAGGSVPPLKKSHAKTHVLTPGFPAGKLIRTKFQSIQSIQPKTAMAFKPISKNQPPHFH
jgi:hypothetical protein